MEKSQKIGGKLVDFWWKRQESVEKLSTKCGKLVEKCADVGIFDVEKCVRRHSANKKRAAKPLFILLPHI